MYTKQEAALLKEQFWTTLGKYLAPIPSSGGNKINWINYKTGVRFINFKMDVNKEGAYIGIELSHPGADAQELFFNHFKTLQAALEQETGETWVWEQAAHVNGKSISRIYRALNGVNIYNRTDWPPVIAFLKTGIISLDSFWTANKEIFEMLS